MSTPEFARAQLLSELRELSFQLTRTQWAPEINYKIYAVLAGDAEAVDGKPLANPILAHVDALEAYSLDAGGWPSGDTVDSYVDLDAWKKLYADWKTTPKG